MVTRGSLRGPGRTIVRISSPSGPLRLS